MSLIKPKWLHVSFVILFLFFFFFVFFNYANEKPRGIHQWAQADRLAIAERFIEGRSVVDPATLSIKSEDGKVGVEFSGYQYLIAQIVRLGYPHKYLPFLYRFLTYTLFFCSLFVLVFNILKEESILFKSLVFIGLFSSPILLYYSYNFLPDILALTLLLWCFYLMHNNFEKHFIPILLISGLSLFIKTSSGIYFISFFAIFFLKHVRKPNRKLLISGLLFALIGAGVAYYDYFLVNQRNAKLYSYVFLSGTRPAQNWSEFVEIFTTAKRFLKEYLNTSQWLVIGLLLIYQLIRTKQFRITNKHLQLSFFVALGLLSIIILFGIQYKDHDYYVLGTFMPILLFFTLKSIAQVAEYIHPRTAVIIASLFAVVSFTQGSNRYFNRMSENVLINGHGEPYKREWLIDADKKIAPYVPKNELVYVIYVPEPNFSLIYFARNGATFNAEEMARDNSPFNWFQDLQDAKYVVCPATKLEQYHQDQEEFISNSTILFSDNYFTLYKVNGY
ncbi:MAG: hypothetical protein HKP14_05280 [Bacteroidia bacterium]|nr:hypothetical protein [Bacteroidia bacterium]